MKTILSKQSILGLTRAQKRAINIFTDYTLLLLALIISLSISKSFDIVKIDLLVLLQLIIHPLIIVIIFYYFGIYQSIIRYLNIDGILRLSIIFGIIVIGDYIIARSSFVYMNDLTNNATNSWFSYETWIICWLLSFIFIVSVRVAAKKFFIDLFERTKVIIYGAGSAGIQLANALTYGNELLPIGYIDNNKILQGTMVGGLKVFSPKSLEGKYLKGNVDLILIAIPSASRSTLRKVLKELERYSIKVKILPSLEDVAQGRVSINKLKDVDIKDLLDRKQVVVDQNLVSRNIKNKVVMITGAGGSIGSEISEQVLDAKPAKLIILDQSEYGLYSINKKLEEKIGNRKLKLYPILCDVTNEKKLTNICRKYKIQTIYHAAAYKHVPLVEENPFEGVRNNIFGTLYCINAAIKNNVETFVFVSTDKAVRPTNIMGASKRFAEMLLQAISNNLSKSHDIKITMVRFGNVIGSSGSAIPLFQEQINNGGPITVTHPNVVRYFMTISEATNLVLQAGALARGGEVFILDMGEPIKITEIAKKLIKLNGMEEKTEKNPQGDIEIVYTGLRKGEKLYEELLIGNDALATKNAKIFKANETFLDFKILEKLLIELEEAEEKLDIKRLKEIFSKSVSGFTSKIPS